MGHGPYSAVGMEDERVLRTKRNTTGTLDVCYPLKTTKGEGGTRRSCAQSGAGKRIGNITNTSSHRTTCILPRREQVSGTLRRGTRSTTLEAAKASAKLALGCLHRHQQRHAEHLMQLTASLSLGRSPACSPLPGALRYPAPHDTGHDPPNVPHYR